MVMRILFNADDYGITKGVTDGIIESFTNGIVRSTTMIMNGYAVDYAVTAAKKHPGLKVGIHLALTFGKPLLEDVPELVDEAGKFKFVSRYNPDNSPDLEQLEREWRAQIEAFLATGLPLNHIDSHHHVHQWEVLENLVVLLAKEYKVPVRYVPSIKKHPEIHLTEKMFDGFYDAGVSTTVFEDVLRKYPDAESVEVMTHPAFIDNKLREISSYVDKRTDELEILTNLTIPDWAEV